MHNTVNQDLALILFTKKLQKDIYSVSNDFETFLILFYQYHLDILRCSELLLSNEILTLGASVHLISAKFSRFVDTRPL